MGISDLSSDVCSSDLDCGVVLARLRAPARARPGLRPPGGGRAGQPRQPVPNHPGHVPGPDRHLRPEAGPAAPLRARTDVSKDGFAKVPEVTLGFWIIKVLVTTLGETGGDAVTMRSEEHTSELQSLMRISYAVFCLKKKKKTYNTRNKEIEYTSLI